MFELLRVLLAIDVDDVVLIKSELLSRNGLGISEKGGLLNNRRFTCLFSVADSGVGRISSLLNAVSGEVTGERVRFGLRLVVTCGLRISLLLVLIVVKLNLDK